MLVIYFFSPLAGTWRWFGEEWFRGGSSGGRGGAAGIIGCSGGGLVVGGSMVWGLFSPFFAVGDLWAVSGIKGWVPHLPGVILLVGFSGTLLVILLSTWSGIAICGCSVS